MRLSIVVLTLLVAGAAAAATKTDLTDSLVATGDYLYVSDPIVETSPFGSGVAKYKIVMLVESPIDTLVALTTQTYIWVMDDGLPTERAFYHRNNLVDPPAATVSFRSLVETYMITQTIDGYVVETGAFGNVEWATAIRYSPGSDGSHVVQESAWITRTDGTTWSVKIVD